MAYKAQAGAQKLRLRISGDVQSSWALPVQTELENTMIAIICSVMKILLTFINS